MSTRRCGESHVLVGLLVEVGVEDSAIQLICDPSTVVGFCNEVLEGRPGSVHIAVQVLLQQVI